MTQVYLALVRTVPVTTAVSKCESGFIAIIYLADDHMNRVWISQAFDHIVQDQVG